MGIFKPLAVAFNNLGKFLKINKQLNRGAEWAAVHPGRTGERVRGGQDNAEDAGRRGDPVPRAGTHRRS